MIKKIFLLAVLALPISAQAQVWGANNGTVTYFDIYGQTTNVHANVSSIYAYDEGSVQFREGNDKKYFHGSYEIVIHDHYKEQVAVGSEPELKHAKKKVGQLLPVFIVIFVVLLGAALILLYFMKKDNDYDDEE